MGALQAKGSSIYKDSKAKDRHILGNEKFPDEYNYKCEGYSSYERSGEVLEVTPEMLKD